MVTREPGNGVRMLLIDNYDSFTYNLVQAFAALGADVAVFRNDAIDVAQARALEPTHLVISPGPGRPEDAGISLTMIEAFARSLPVLGVCLGHQAIAAAFGADIVRAPEPVHGRTSLITHDGSRLFDGLPNPCRVTRYHSLVIDESTAPECLSVTSRTTDDLIMAFEHRFLPVFGVQFHPEAVLTQSGHRLLVNFLIAAGLASAASVDLSTVGDALGSDGLAREIASSFADCNSDGSWPSSKSGDRTLHW